MIYPITVASKSNVASRKMLALNIMGKMREHSSLLVDQVGSNSVSERAWLTLRRRC